MGTKTYFNRSGELRHIKTLRYWGLGDVLQQKYRMHPVEAQNLASFLIPMLSLMPDQRATAQQLLAHPWVRGLPSPEVQEAYSYLGRYQMGHPGVSDEEYKFVSGAVSAEEYNKLAAANAAALGGYLGQSGAAAGDYKDYKYGGSSAMATAMQDQQRLLAAAHAAGITGNEGIVAAVAAQRELEAVNQNRVPPANADAAVPQGADGDESDEFDGDDLDYLDHEDETA